MWKITLFSLLIASLTVNSLPKDSFSDEALKATELQSLPSEDEFDEEEGDDEDFGEEFDPEELEGSDQELRKRVFGSYDSRSAEQYVSSQYNPSQSYGSEAREVDGYVVPSAEPRYKSNHDQLHYYGSHDESGVSDKRADGYDSFPREPTYGSVQEDRSNEGRLDDPASPSADPIYNVSEYSRSFRGDRRNQDPINHNEPPSLDHQYYGSYGEQVDSYQSPSTTPFHDEERSNYYGLPSSRQVYASNYSHSEYYGSYNDRRYDGNQSMDRSTQGRGNIYDSSPPDPTPDAPTYGAVNYNQSRYYGSSGEGIVDFETLPAKPISEVTFGTSENNTLNYNRSYIEEQSSTNNGGESNGAYIDDSDQEITFEDSRDSERQSYSPEYHREPSRSNEPRYEPPLNPTEADTRMPVYEPLIIPQKAYTVAYNESSPIDDNRLIYQPDSGSDYHRQLSQSGESYPRLQEATTNSYEKRMSQVDEYWREDERQKQMYESQNIYRRPSDSERLDNWRHGSCTYDSMGRPVDCSPDSATKWDTYDSIAIHAPPPELDLSPSANGSATSAAVEEAEAELSAFRRANRVHLSATRWPVRDMNRLGVYPQHPACRLPPKWGIGPEGSSAWFYSKANGRCLWFSYAGHGGNANRFYSRANCETLCVFDQYDLCQNAQCGYPGSRCMLRGDESCKAYAKSLGRDPLTECPPDQPVCRARRAIIPPEYDTQLVPNECLEEVDSGGCLVKNPQIRYHYDARSNTCRSFYFHGCGGNNNRFESMQECMNHCAL